MALPTPEFPNFDPAALEEVRSLNAHMQTGLPGFLGIETLDIEAGRMMCQLPVRDVISISKRTAVMRIDITNDGRGVAAAQGTVLIMPPRAASS